MVDSSGLRKLCHVSIKEVFVKHLLLEPDFDAWRTAARESLHSGYRPQEIDFQDATVPSALTLTLERDEQPHGIAMTHATVPRAFLEAAKIAAVHRDPRRWNLLYRVLFRIQSEPELLKLETDGDIIELQRLEAEVNRDLHRMQAFLQFRKVLEPGDPAERPVVVDEPVLVSLDAYPKSPEHHLVLETPTPFGPVQTELEQCAPPEPRPDEECEHFIAWYQPDHRILPLAAPFFAERFAILRWTILTPDATSSWDPVAKQLSFAAGIARHSSPTDDELETLWRTYYRSNLYARVRPVR